MKLLSNYILEKFKISKDITNQEEYKPGDYLLRVFVSNVKYLQKDKDTDKLFAIELGTSNNALSIFSRLDDNGFYFINHKNSREDRYDYEMKHEINSNGYLEFDNVTKSVYSFKSISLYLKKDIALEFLNKILNDRNNIKKYIFDYFDKKYEKYFDLSLLYVNESTDSIEKLIRYLNENT